MPIGNKELDELFSKVAPVILPPAEYPPADVVRDTPREEIIERITDNASAIGIEFTEEHWDVVNFLFDFYKNCCENKPTAYKGRKKYWEYIDCVQNNDCEHELDGADKANCKFGKLSRKEATKAYRVYRVLLKAYKNKGGKKQLYKLFPYGPLFTIHLLAQLPRLTNDVDPHYGIAY